jgi:hypothetical protein
MSSGSAHANPKWTSAADECRPKQHLGTLREVGVHAAILPIKPMMPPCAQDVAEVIPAAVRAHFRRKRVKETVDKERAKYQTEWN